MNNDVRRSLASMTVTFAGFGQEFRNLALQLGDDGLVVPDFGRVHFAPQAFEPAQAGSGQPIFLAKAAERRVGQAKAPQRHGLVGKAGRDEIQVEGRFRHSASIPLMGRDGKHMTDIAQAPAVSGMLTRSEARMGQSHGGTQVRYRERRDAPPLQRVPATARPGGRLIQISAVGVEDGYFVA